VTQVIASKASARGLRFREVHWFGGRRDQRSGPEHMAVGIVGSYRPRAPRPADAEGEKAKPPATPIGTSVQRRWSGSIVRRSAKDLATPFFTAGLKCTRDDGNPRSFAFSTRPVADDQEDPPLHCPIRAVSTAVLSQAVTPSSQLLRSSSRNFRLDFHHRRVLPSRDG
jgi:hypothetical protein